MRCKTIFKNLACVSDFWKVKKVSNFVSTPYIPFVILIANEKEKNSSNKDIA